MKFRKITIIDITTAAFLLVLIVLSKQSFFTINFGVMRLGLSYTFLIVAGLILNFLLALFVAILGDTLGLVLNGSIGFWHYAYFLIPIMIVLITRSLKFLLQAERKSTILICNGLFFIFMVLAIFVLLIVKHNFIKKSQNDALAIDLTNPPIKILIWIMFALMAFYSLVISICYYKNPRDKLKDYVVINIIVTVIIIVLIWFYGPFANLLWISDQLGQDYWSSYGLYQIPRLLKTPLLLPIYNFIVVAIFKIYKLLLVKTNDQKW